MADSYLSISQIANDDPMVERLRASATQQSHLGNAPQITDPLTWVDLNRYVWASSPGWGAAWDSALAAHPDDPDQPGQDPAVITDGMILATVQQLGGTPAQPPPEEEAE
jgi:hypothetical protein